MEKLKLGIIGCGSIATWHAKAIKMSKNGILAGVADAKKENAKRFSENNENVKYFDSIDEMLKSDEIDAVTICTPSGFHASVALEAINAGKHVLIEKPLAITNEDCQKVIKAAKEKGVCAGVISQHRFIEAIQELKGFVSGGKLGKLITADLLMKYYRSQEYYDSSAWRGTWALDGGALMNQGIHGVDLLLYIMGPVKRVFGCINTLTHDIEAEDTSVATVEFQNGALAVIQSTTSIYKGFPRSLTISGTKGTVTVKADNISRCEIEGLDYNLKPENAVVNSFNDPKALDISGHAFQIQDFIDAVINKTEPMIPLEDGFRAVEVINAVYSSSKTGKAVVLNQN
ncbi:MAG: Gfo/Idh/MocA family oxidoreductase [Ruminococcaceae bacterium]|nr:Gfo/Idh/MocA family oxidoreductase [Oscillospiraceae bacterium]